MRVGFSLGMTGAMARAKILFDFTGGALPAGTSFARAGSAAYFGAAGLMQTAAAGQPRFDHDPATLTPLGLLVEPQRTNLVTYSSDIGQWTSTGAKIASGTTAAPGGEIVNFYECYNQALYLAVSGYAIGQPHSNSVWLKANSSQSIGLRLPGDAGADKAALAVTMQWKRFSATQPAEAASSFLLLEMRNASGHPVPGDFKLAIWRAQSEAGAARTSAIATAGSAVTRAAETLTLGLGDGDFMLSYGFDDGSIQTAAITVAGGGGYIVPTGLARPWIRTITAERR